MPERLPAVFIINEPYISLDRCAHDYRRLLAGMGALAPTLEAADVVVLQCGFTEIVALLQQLPALRHKKCVGLLVWEADRLPPATPAHLRHFDVIWTPSWYSARSFVPHHKEVLWLPHVIRAPLDVTPAAAARVRAMLGDKPGCTLLQIGRLQDRRKGADDVEAAVRALARRLPGLTLVRKSAHPSIEQKPLEVRRSGPVVDVVGYLDDPTLAALMAYADYVVSGHHGEAWGLTLSEAMAAGVPPIAPAYSGNLAFMAQDTGWLIPAAEEPIRPEHSLRPANRPHGHMAAPMRWSTCLPGQMQSTLEQAAHAVGTPRYADMARRAQRQARAYDDRHVAVMLARALRRLGA